MEKQNFFSRWSSFFIRRWRVTILFLVAAVVAGIWGLKTNSVQDFPEIPTNYVSVSAVYPGANAHDIEQKIINPLESSIGEIEGIANYRAVAQDNVGYLTIELERIDNAVEKEKEIKTAADGVNLPADVTVNTELFDVGGPTLAFALYGDGVTQNQLLELAPKVKSYLEDASTDIKKVDIIPDPATHISITLDADKLAAAGLTKQQVVNTLTAATTVLPAGAVKDEQGVSTPVTVITTVAALDDIAQLSMGAVRLQDIADITREPAAGDTLSRAGFIDADGNKVSTDAVYAMVYKTKKGDIGTIATDVHKAIDAIHTQSVVPDNVELATVYDTSGYIKDSISTLLNNGLIGLVLILVVLGFFINVRTGLVVAVLIPLSFLITLFILPLIGFTINILVLFAMILVLGILVDNAIVIAEGIAYNLEHGLTKLDAVMKSVRELGPAVTVATATTFIVFIPFASLDGIIGAFMKFIPYTVMIMLAVSFVLALTITPLFSYVILKEESAADRRNRKLKTWEKVIVLPAVFFYGQRFVDWLVEVYVRLGKKVLPSLAARLVLLLVTLAVFGGSVAVFTTIPFEQFSSNDSNAAMVSLTRLPHDFGSVRQRELYESIGDVLINAPHFVSYFNLQGQLFITFTDPREREDHMNISQIVDRINQDMEPIRAGLPVDARLQVEAQSEGPPGASADLSVEFVAEDQTVLETAAEDFVGYVRDTRDDVDYINNAMADDKTDSIAVTLKDVASTSNALSPMVVSTLLNGALTETEAGQVAIRADGTSEKLEVSMAQENRRAIGDVKDVAVGPVSTLGAVADVGVVSELNTIKHLNGQRVASVNVKLRKLDDIATATTRQAELTKQAEDYLSDRKLKDLGLMPNDVIYGGVLASENQDTQDLLVIFVIAVVAVLLILIYQFNSYGQPLLIMLTIPLAFIGVSFGLKLAGQTTNFISALGIVAVVGIVVNDAVVYIDYLNRFRKTHPDMSFDDILVKTGQARFKPIFSTSITTIGGILPLTISDPFWTGLGVSIIGGLVFSTLGTMIVIPVCYYQIVRMRKWMVTKWTNRRKIRKASAVSGT